MAASFETRCETGHYEAVASAADHSRLIISLPKTTDHRNSTSHRPLARARQASALTHTDGAGGGVASPCVGLPSGSAETSPTVAVRRQRERRRPWLSSAGPCNRQVTHDRCGRHRGRHGRHGPCADRLRRRVADRSEATQRPEGSTPLTTETQLQVAAQLSISVSVLVRCPAMHNFRSLRQMMVQRRRRNHASSLRLTGHHAAWRAGFIHASSSAQWL